MVSDHYCECFYFSAARLSRVLDRIAEEAFAPAGLSAPHAFALMAIADIDAENLAIGDLAELLGIDPSTMTRFADSLVHKGLAIRSKNGRRTELSATEKGRNLGRELIGNWRKLHENIEAKLGPGEQDRLAKRLEKARKLLEK